MSTSSCGRCVILIPYMTQDFDQKEGYPNSSCQPLIAIPKPLDHPSGHHTTLVV